MQAHVVLRHWLPAYCLSASLPPLTRLTWAQRVSLAPPDSDLTLNRDGSDTNVTDSIKTVAASMAEDMMSFYHGHEPGGTPGLLPQPYYCKQCCPLRHSQC